jgi:hypothetical protein
LCAFAWSWSSVSWINDIGDDDDTLASILYLNSTIFYLEIQGVSFSNSVIVLSNNVIATITISPSVTLYRTICGTSDDSWDAKDKDEKSYNQAAHIVWLPIISIQIIQERFTSGIG